MQFVVRAWPVVRGAPAQSAVDAAPQVDVVTRDLGGQPEELHGAIVEDQQDGAQLAVGRPERRCWAGLAGGVLAPPLGSEVKIQRVEDIAADVPGIGCRQ